MIGMKPLERLEEFVGIGHIKARPIVAHKIDLFAVLLEGPNLNSCPWVFVGKLPGVLDQVGQGRVTWKL